MDAYHIALLLHILTLIAAASATAVTKLAASRRMCARTVAEALEWHALLVSASRAFPICLGVFLATGVYMVSIAGGSSWSSGFVVSGFAGVALLLGSGTYLGIKAKGQQRVLESMARANAEAPVPLRVPPRPIAILPVVNTGVALSVVFDMVTKPASVPVALGVIAIGIVASATLALRSHPATAARQSTESAAARAA